MMRVMLFFDPDHFGSVVRRAQDRGLVHAGDDVRLIITQRLEVTVDRAGVVRWKYAQDTKIREVITEMRVSLSDIAHPSGRLPLGGVLRSTLQGFHPDHIVIDRRDHYCEIAEKVVHAARMKLVCL